MSVSGHDVGVRTYGPPMASVTTTDLPPDEIPEAGIGGWVMRADQALVLADAMDETVPDAPAGGYLMRSEAVLREGRADGWSVVLDDADPREHIEDRGRQMLEQLGVPDAPEKTAVMWADFRGLTTDGRPAGRNDPCACGSGRKAKKCVHAGPPRLFARARMLGSQQQWDAFLATQPKRWKDSPARMVPGQARIAVEIGPLAGTLISGTTDSPPTADPVDAADYLVDALMAGAVSRAPFLRGAQILLVRIPAEDLD